MADDAPGTSNAARALPPRRPRGRWSLHVERFFWLIGVGAIFLIGLAWVAANGGTLDPGSLLGLAALAVVGGWGIARWLGSDRRRPEATLGWGISAVLLFFVLAPLYAWVVSRAAPTMVWLGGFERLLLLPTLCAFLMVAAGGLGLHAYVSRVAVLLIGLGFFAVDDTGDYPRERVLTATQAQLVASERSGDPVVVRGVDHDQGERVTRTRPASASICRTAHLVDRRRTLVGLPGRRLSIRAEACWSGPGRPVSLVVVHHLEQGNERGAIRAVRLVPVDGFDVQAPGLITDEHDGDEPRAAAGLRYGDAASDLAEPDGGLERGPDGLAVRDRRGRPLSDGRQSNDTAIARVENRGETIEVRLAFESSDLLRRESDGDDVDDSDPERTAGPAPDRGTERDLVRVTLDRTGPSSGDVERYREVEPDDRN